MSEPVEYKDGDIDKFFSCTPFMRDADEPAGEMASGRYFPPPGWQDEPNTDTKSAHIAEAKEAVCEAAKAEQIAREQYEVAHRTSMDCDCTTIVCPREQAAIALAEIHKRAKDAYKQAVDALIKAEGE